MGDGQPTALYRFYSADDELLYAGISCNLAGRLVDHRRKPWWPMVATTAVEYYGNRDDALRAELRAIRDERPRHNKYHRTASSFDVAKAWHIGWQESHAQEASQRSPWIRNNWRPIYVDAYLSGYRSERIGEDVRTLCGFTSCWDCPQI